jgi:hypothetical protein
MYGRHKFVVAHVDALTNNSCLHIGETMNNKSILGLPQAYGIEYPSNSGAILCDN